MSSDASDKKSPSWTILKVLNWTESYFKLFKIDSPRLAAEILLCHCLNIKRLDLYLQYDRPLNKKELASYRELILKRAQREPVAYITGNKGFWESEFSVNPFVLIPRPDTEILVETCLEILNNRHGADLVTQRQPASKSKNAYFKEAVQKFHIKPKTKTLKILELGAGSGAVIISLAKAFSSNSYFAIDISPAAAEATAKTKTSSSQWSVLKKKFVILMLQILKRNIASTTTKKLAKNMADLSNRLNFLASIIHQPLWFFAV